MRQQDLHLNYKAQPCLHKAISTNPFVRFPNRLVQRSVSDEFVVTKATGASWDIQTQRRYRLEHFPTIHPIGHGLQQHKLEYVTTLLDQRINHKAEQSQLNLKSSICRKLAARKLQIKRYHSNTGLAENTLSN